MKLIYLDDSRRFIFHQSMSRLWFLQRSEVLELIWNQDDTWPTFLCRLFILQWASMLENKVLFWLGDTEREQNGLWKLRCECFCAAETHADWRLAGDAGGQTAWSDDLAGPSAGQSCHLQLDQRSASSAWGGRRVKYGISCLCFSSLDTKIIIKRMVFDHFAAKRVAWRASGKDSGGPAVGLALEACSQPADRHGAGHVDFSVPEVWEGESVGIQI